VIVERSMVARKPKLELENHTAVKLKTAALNSFIPIRNNA
jgi:hypothetical protein